MEAADLYRSLGADAPRLAELVERTDAAAGRLGGRVTRVDRGRFQALTTAGSVPIATTGVAPVCVGDWCVVHQADDEDAFELDEVLPRAAMLVRQSSGGRTEVQALAANIDVVTVVVPLDRPVSGRQIERFLAMAWDSGAQPVLALTKADLIDEAAHQEARSEVDAVRRDVPVLTISVITGAGMPELESYCREGSTMALLGTSGSGKSSLVNALMGAEVVQTGAVREADAKGRHTTTWRELLVVPDGGVLIDTPGLRELGMWIADEGIDAVFTDVTDLAEQCRFNDCAHEHEPDCAVRDAIEQGRLDPERLASYRKLLSEAAFADRQNDTRLARENQRVVRHRETKGRKKSRP
jgi:ribosome biogenesis GTPase / thiamine phosphate phosphatase